MCCGLNPLASLQQSSRENSKQLGAERDEAAGKLRSIRSGDIRPVKPSVKSPRSKLQDIFERPQQSSSADSLAASQASTSRQALFDLSFQRSIWQMRRIC